MSGRAWTKDELEQLDSFPDAVYDRDLVSTFPGRTKTAIALMRRQLREKRTGSPNINDQIDTALSELDQSILRMARKGIHTVAELADALDRGPASIQKSIDTLQARNYRLTIGSGHQIEIQLPQRAGVVEIPLRHFMDGKWYRFGGISDTHLCNKHSRLDVLNAAYDVYKAEGIREVFHGGNWVDGEASFNKMELITPPGFEHQINYFLDHYPRRDNIVTRFVSGDDHEGWWAQREGIDIGKRLEQSARAMGRTDLVDLGYAEADMIFSHDGNPVRPGERGAMLRLLHAGGGSAYALSYTPQGIINSYQPGEKPNILFIGHYHKAELMPHYRGVATVQLGTTCDQTLFMRKKKLDAHVGFWIIEFKVSRDGAVSRFRAEFFPFYDRGFYVDKYAIGDTQPSKVA